MAKCMATVMYVQCVWQLQLLNYTEMIDAGPERTQKLEHKTGEKMAFSPKDPC